MLSADGVCAPSIAGFAASCSARLLKAQGFGFCPVCLGNHGDTTALTCSHASAFVLVAAMPPLSVHRDPVWCY